MKAIIPAAGLGTRFLPATKSIPKELLPVLNKPVIQYVVEEALAPSEVDECIIINSRDKHQIDNYFAENTALEDILKERGKHGLAKCVRSVSDMPVSFVYQDEPKGLGHAVACAADHVGDDPFFVLLGDYFVPDCEMNAEMQRVSQDHGGASVIAVAPVELDEVNRYGIIAGECIGSIEGGDCGSYDEGAVWKVSGLVEKPQPEDAPSRLFIVGRYLLSPRIMELLKSQTPGAGGEIQLTDAMERLLDEEEMFAVVVDPKRGCDTGTPLAWAATNARMALESENNDEFRDALGHAAL